MHLAMHLLFALFFVQTNTEPVLILSNFDILLLISATFSFVLHSESCVLLCAAALFLLLPRRALFMSRAEVLIKVFACSLRGGKCKTHSTIEVGDPRTLMLFS